MFGISLPRTAIIFVLLQAFLFTTQTGCGVEPPKHRVVFQPFLLWLDAEPTQQGTGFFAQTPKGDVVAITSAHFLNSDGPPLIGAAWMDVKTFAAVDVFTHSLGNPGKGRDFRQGKTDLRSDYLIMPATGIDAKTTL